MQVNFLTIIPYFKVTERYVINGRTKVMRRDLRSGEAVATGERVEGGVRLNVTFGSPFAGAPRPWAGWQARVLGWGCWAPAFVAGAT